MLIKEEKERRPIYRVCLKERKSDGRRIPIKHKDFESSSGAIKYYEELLLENEKVGEKLGLIVEMQFIFQSKYSTLQEKHI